MVISAQLVVRYLSTRNMLNESTKKYPNYIYESKFLSENFDITKKNNLQYICDIETMVN